MEPLLPWIVGSGLLMSVIALVGSGVTLALYAHSSAFSCRWWRPSLARCVSPFCYWRELARSHSFASDIDT
jgi:hypothetical protein